MSATARLAVVLAAILSAACTSPGEGGPRHTGVATGPTGEATGPITLRVMEFNVEYGGTAVDFDGVPEAIEASGADIVAIEEGYGNMPDIAASVGWPYYDERTQVTSRFPILRVEDAPYVYVEIAPGRVVAVANVHLPSTGYGPFKAADGATVQELVAVEERKRLPPLRPVLDALAPLADAGVPVFLVGDFNAPSHLDWVPEAVGLRDHVAFPVPWPVSRAVEDAGFVDSYREANPDPVADPGLTWPANRPTVPGYNPFRNGAPADRIDVVYAGGPVQVTDSRLVGEGGGPDVEIEVDPWPTDHRAPVSTFEVRPAAAPTIVSPDRRLVEVGDEVRLRYVASGDPAGSIAIVPSAGGDAIAEEAVGGSTGGEVDVATPGWDPGAYDAVLWSASGGELARATFWVERVDAAPEIATARASYAPGEPVEVLWRSAPGNRWDWVGVYRRDADPSRASYLSWVYTGATIEGSAVFDRDGPGAWPLEPGEYSVYLLRDDGYADIAADAFTVRSEA